MQRWNRNTDVQLWRRSERFLKLFDWAMQAKFEDISEGVLCSQQWLDTLLTRMDIMSGERE
eukprot:7936558-Pyramimonas_sp.AAC.1